MGVVLFNITPYKKNGSHFSGLHYSCVSGKIKIYLFIYLFMVKKFENDSKILKYCSVAKPLSSVSGLSQRVPGFNMANFLTLFFLS